MNWERAIYGRILHLWQNGQETVCGKELYRLPKSQAEVDVGEYKKCDKCLKLLNQKKLQL